MKLSVDDELKNHLHFEAEIYLNGHLVKNVTECDTEEGYLTRFKMENGKTILNENGDALELETLRGVVTIMHNGKIVA